MTFLVLLGAFVAVAGLGGEIAYIDLSAGVSGAVCVVDAATGATRQVGPGQEDGAPRWSPDGEWLGFDTGTEAGRGVYVVRANGDDGRIIDAARDWNFSPCWSTDGRRVAYSSSDRAGELAELRVYDLNTGVESVWAGGRLGLARPQWLPYSELMFFLSPERELKIPGVDLNRFLDEARMKLLQLANRTLPEAVLAIGLSPEERDGETTIRTSILLVSKSEALPLLEVAGGERDEPDAVVWAVAPNWAGYSYRGAPAPGVVYGAGDFDETGETTRIAFESNEGGDREVYVLGSKGIANVSNHRAADWNPVWSPDGRTLAIESFRDGNRGIYRVYADTAHVEGVAVERDAACWSPTWSSDGERIAYVCDKSGQAELYTTGVRAGGAVPLTDGGGPKEAPAWRPERP